MSQGQVIDQGQQDDAIDENFRGLIEKSKEEARQREAEHLARMEAERSNSPRQKSKCANQLREKREKKKREKREKLVANLKLRRSKRPKKTSRTTFFGHGRTPGPRPMRTLPPQLEDVAA